MTTLALEYSPLRPEVIADPYPYYAALRRDAPVRFVEELSMWVVSRYADVVRVARDPELFTNQAMAEAVTRPTTYGDVEEREELPLSIVGTDGEYHARLRRIVNRGFTPRRMAALEDRVREVAASLADAFAERDAVELIEHFAAPLPVIVISELLGVDPARRHDFRRWSEWMVFAVFEAADEAQAAEILRSGEEMGEWCDEVVEQRHRAPGTDLISTLVRAEADEVLTPAEVRIFVFTLMVAGSITTTHLMANMMRAAIANAEAVAAVRERPELAASFVEESLRFDAPVQLMLRTAARDVEVAGVTIPAGATVAPLIGSANRDEAVFADPDRFDVRRDAREHLAFGHGVHFCLGAALARLEARVAFEELLARIEAPRLAGDVEFVESVVFRGPQRLDLTFRPAAHWASR
jgi:cytochrome P450